MTADIQICKKKCNVFLLLIVVFICIHRESQVELREHIDNLATGDVIHIIKLIIIYNLYIFPYMFFYYTIWPNLPSFVHIV